MLEKIEAAFAAVIVVSLVIQLGMYVGKAL